MNKKTLLGIVEGLPDNAEIEAVIIRGFTETRIMPGITPFKDNIEIKVGKY